MSVTSVEIELKGAMNSRKISMIFLIASISIIGFALHLFWEYLQCSPLYIHLKVVPTFWSMINATFGDVSILWSSYLIVAAFRKSFVWPWDSTSLISFALLAFISAVISEFIEYFAIIRQLWFYNLINPTINGISVVPFFQMAFINPLTILIAKKTFTTK
ncbi:MAG: hypothetical protein H7281_11380 [Bacteriovorax sp.]|nr:hypothetical protein [Bacteriovorax sp.]